MDYMTKVVDGKTIIVENRFRTQLKEIRDRLIIDPKDDLGELIGRIEREQENEKEGYKQHVLERIVLRSLFDGDYKRAHLAMSKCALLNSQTQINSEDATEVLQTIWDSLMMVGYQNGMEELMDRMNCCEDME